MRTLGQHRELSGVFDVLDALDDEVVVLDASGQIIASNEAWERFSAENGGDPTRCSVGNNYMSVCSTAEGFSSSEARIIPDGLRRTLTTGETFRCEYPCDSPTEKRWFELTANRYPRNDQNYLIVQHRNITRRHVESDDIEQALINSDAMATVVATTSDAIICYDLDGRIITWNRSAERLYGYTSADIVGQPLETLYPSDWPKRVSYYRDEIIAGRLQDFEATRVAKDGTEREVWISCAPIRRPDGEIIAISNIHRDVTSVRRAERARDLIAREVIHRAKNMLSVVTAIQRQTARSAETLEGFNESFGQRLASLTKSTDLLVHNSWADVPLKDVVVSHLEPFVSPEANRSVKIEGPSIYLQPECVQTIGMAVHELATNSAKYGALVQDKGEVQITWDVPRRNGPLHFEWSEKGIVVDSGPRRKGFGNTVLTSHAKAVLNAEVSYDIGPDGVTWTINVPPNHFEADSGGSDTAPPAQ